MKMQFITMGLEGHNFTISRKLVDTKNHHNTDCASCSIIILEPSPYCKSGFIASGFSSFESSITEHDMNNTNETIDDFVKEVFAQ